MAVTGQLELDQGLVRSPDTDLKVDRAAAVIWLAVDVEYAAEPDDTEEQLDFGFFCKRLTSPVDHSPTILVLNIVLEGLHPGQHGIVAGPPTLVEVGLVAQVSYDAFELID